MNPRELVEKMLEWEKTKIRLDELEEEIQKTVLGLQKTQTVGNVRASYSKGRNSYDYRGGAKDVELSIIEKHTTEIPATTSVDWKAVCEDAGVKEIPLLREGKPKVTVKLMG